MVPPRDALSIVGRNARMLWKWARVFMRNVLQECVSRRFKFSIGRGVEERRGY
jgi:hypothetical protein